MITNNFEFSEKSVNGGNEKQFFFTETLFRINIRFELRQKVLTVQTRNSFFFTETLFRINIIIYHNEKF